MHPPFLQADDEIALIAPANRINPAFLEQATTELESWGFRVRLGNHVRNQHYRFAGTDEERLKDLQEALDRPSVRAILCARGGYGTVRLVDQIDWSGFSKHPKWIIGFSDVTVLHSHIHTHLGIETLHATVPLNFSSGHKNSLITLRQALLGDLPAYTFDRSDSNRLGATTGTFVGGNLSLLCSLIGTPSDIDTTGKILFLEEVSEYTYHIDRMLHQLDRSGKLKDLAGLVIGGLTDIKQGPNPMHADAERLISEIVTRYSYPVAFELDAGHQEPNLALYLGATCTLEITQTGSKLVFTRG